jgi:GNAT superfamily N-acetyltransferase
LFEQPHRAMADFYESTLPPIPELMQSSDQKYRYYAAPRETLKTTIGVQALAEYFVLKWKHRYNYDARVLVVRAAREAAEGVLMANSEDFRSNPVILKAFGDLSTNSPKWTTSAIVFNNRTVAYREPTIDTAGTGMSKTGAHYDAIFLDDLCNERNFESEVEMLHARRYVQACIPVLNNWGSMVHTGTRWGNLDTTGYILELNELAERMGQPSPWQGQIHSCYLEDGELFYPAFLSERKLQQKKMAMEDRLFSSQYLNVVVAEGSQVFDPAWLSYYDGDYTPDGEDIASLDIFDPRESTVAVSAAIVIDPAATATASSNSTAMAFVLMDVDGAMYVHDCWKGREVPSLILDRIIEWCVRYRPTRLSIDTLGQQILWIDPIQRLLRESGLRCQVILHRGKAIRFGGEEIRSTRGVLSKAARIEALQPFFRNGKIKFRRGRCGPLIKEYKTYTGPTHSEHYDGLDALAQAPAVCVLPRVEKFVALREEDEWRAEFAEEPEVLSERVRAVSTGRHR